MAGRRPSHGHLKESNLPHSKGIEEWQIEAHSDVGGQIIIIVSSNPGFALPLFTGSG